MGGCWNGREAASPSLSVAPFYAQTISAGDSHSLALSRRGQLLSWGMANYGRLGFSEGVRVQLEPVALGGLPTVRAVACGANHSLAVTMRGTLYAWGCGEHGQLGKPIVWEKKTKQQHLTPAQPFQLRCHAEAPGLASAQQRLGLTLHQSPTVSGPTLRQSRTLRQSPPISDKLRHSPPASADLKPRSRS